MSYLDRVFAVHRSSRVRLPSAVHVRLFYRSNRSGYSHRMSSELEMVSEWRLVIAVSLNAVLKPAKLYRFACKILHIFEIICLICFRTRGWSGGAMVLGKLPVPGRPTIWITVGQGPIALAVGAGGGCLDIFTLFYPYSTLSPSLWETARYRLKYCLKGPLNPKQPTNQPTFVPWVCGLIKQAQLEKCKKAANYTCEHLRLRDHQLNEAFLGT